MVEQHTHSSPGIVAAFGAAILFGFSTPLAKVLLGQVSPLMLSGLLYAGSGLGLAVLLIIRASRRSQDRIAWPVGAERIWLLLAIIAGGGIAPYLLLIGLQATDAASASLTLNLEGVFTALLAWFLFRENFDRRVVLGMGLIVGGGIVLASSSHLAIHGMAGPAAIGAACLFWAIDNNLTRKVSGHDAMFIACSKGLVAGSASIALAVAAGAAIPTLPVMLQAAVLGLIGYGASLVLFVIALRGLGAARTGAYFSLAPFIGALFAVVLGAPLTLQLALAGALMGLGVWLHLTEHHEHLHRHVEREHEHQHVHDEHHKHRHGAEWDGSEPHSHPHRHEPLEHSHPHYPDIHHQHEH
jgi:drug/metabolite transporter (DMT)-like permease